MNVALPLHRRPVAELSGVGPMLEKKLAGLGITTIQDLLFHLPLRYQDSTRLTPIAALRPGKTLLVRGAITNVQVSHGPRRRLQCLLEDGSGVLALRFFHFNRNQQEAMARGKSIQAFGEVRRGGRSLEMAHPEYRLFDPERPPVLEESLRPIYPGTEGIGQNRWRNLTGQALTLAQQTDIAQDLLAGLLEESPRRWPGLLEAIFTVHRPGPEISLSELESGEHPALQRLAFEELLAHNLSLLRLRSKARRDVAPAMAETSELGGQLLASLPFALTSAQRRVGGEIFADLGQPHPMMRLLQGDVGSGKTLVAALAMLHAVGNGFQCALMAPTEVLVEQHLRTLGDWFKPLGVEVAALTGARRGKARETLLADIAAGRAPVIIGTHAVFQEGVSFDRLGLVVVDEQHRFGVQARLNLLDKGAAEGARPHQLTMTATPIPRTLAMSFYADMDTSVIDEMPPGRPPVTTLVVADDRRDQVIRRIRAACAGGRQTYWVCTLIEDSDVLQAQAAETTAKELTQALPGLRVDLVHGRLKAVAKVAAMDAFKAGETQLLVATTVIEVGVDVPNASLMVIENSERLGLAQLHQLRGRVGRGVVESHCVLMYRRPLGDTARVRLETMRTHSDGFAIAEQDLKLRGPGEMLGTRQAGAVDFRIADLRRDSHLLTEIQRVGATLMERFSDRVEPLIQRWIRQGERYGGA